MHRTVAWCAHTRHTICAYSRHMSILCAFCVPYVITYCAWCAQLKIWFTRLKVEHKSFPTSPIALSNSIPGRFWLRSRREQNFRKFSKFSHFRFFSIFLRFLKILMILVAEFNLSYRAPGMELEGAITTVGKDFVHTFDFWKCRAPSQYVHTSGTQYVRTSGTCAFCVPHVCHMSSHTVPVVRNSKNDLRALK